jgi:hypothetical protein
MGYGVESERQRWREVDAVQGVKAIPFAKEELTFAVDKRNKTL